LHSDRTVLPACSHDVWSLGMDHARACALLRIAELGRFSFDCQKVLRPNDVRIVCLAVGYISNSRLLQPLCATVFDRFVLRLLWSLGFSFMVDHPESALEVGLRCVCHHWPVLQSERVTCHVCSSRADFRARN